MEKEDMFEALKGNVKTLNLTDLIRERRQKFIDWVMPYYSQEEKEMLMKRSSNEWLMHDNCIYFEPEWKAGQKRRMHELWQQKQKSISRLEWLQKDLFDLAYPDWEEDEALTHSYQVDTITVKRTEIDAKE